MLSDGIVDVPATTKRRVENDVVDVQTTMRVTKRSGASEAVDLNKIVRAVGRCAVGLPDVDAMRVATKTISGLYDGASTRELDRLSIQTAAGLLHGLAAGTNWVFRDESAHMAFAFEVVRTVRREEPESFDTGLETEVAAMLDEAIGCETQFAEDLLGGGVAGLSVRDIRAYLEFCADQRLATLGFARRYGTKNPLGFMDLQDVQEVTNFFERRVSAYQVGVSGDVVFDAAF